MMVLAFYIIMFVGSLLLVQAFRKARAKRVDYTSLKTVTFGDESAITPDRAASFISILTIFLIWGAFTGSKIVSLHVPGPFIGESSFTYTARNAAGETDDATVYVLVYRDSAKPPTPEVGGASRLLNPESLTAFKVILTLAPSFLVGTAMLDMMMVC